MLRPPPRPTLFPYTTLFRSSASAGSTAASSSMKRNRLYKARATPCPLAAISCAAPCAKRSEEHTSELQSRLHLVCRLLLEKKKKQKNNTPLIPRGQPRRVTR